MIAKRVLLLLLCMSKVEGRLLRAPNSFMRKRIDLNMGSIYGWEHPPYQVPLGHAPAWCSSGGDFGFALVHQNVPGCGHTCYGISFVDGVAWKGVQNQGSWSPGVSCSACPAAEWPSCNSSGLTSATPSPPSAMPALSESRFASDTRHSHEDPSPHRLRPEDFRKEQNRTKIQTVPSSGAQSKTMDGQNLFSLDMSSSAAYDADVKHNVQKEMRFMSNPFANPFSSEPSGSDTSGSLNPIGTGLSKWHQKQKEKLSQPAPWHDKTKDREANLQLMRQAEAEAEKQRLVEEQKRLVKEAAKAEAKAEQAQMKAEASEQKAKEELAAAQQEKIIITATERAAESAEKERREIEEKKTYDDISDAAQLKAAAAASESQSMSSDNDEKGKNGWVEYHITSSATSEPPGSQVKPDEAGKVSSEKTFSKPKGPTSPSEAWLMAYFSSLGQGEEAAQLAARNAWFTFTAANLKQKLEKPHKPRVSDSGSESTDNDDNRSDTNYPVGEYDDTSIQEKKARGKTLRWDIRKAALEKLKHRYQRSPYVCPLSSMRLTPYPDEFGAHQGALTSPDAYRRAMAKAVQAADHIAYIGGGFAGPPSMAYSPELIASVNLQDPDKMVFQPIMRHFFSDFDGRAKYAVMGTPGADLGEFILALSAYESANSMPGRTSSPMSDGDVYQFMSGFLLDMSSMGKSRFAFVTDEAAVQSWTDSAQVTDARHPMTPEGMARAIATSALPGSIGSRHLRFMVENPDVYGVRKGLATAAIRAFFEIYFDSTHPSQPRLMLIVAEGRHEEQGVVVVDRTSMYPEACAKLTPLIVPNTERQEYFVYHRAAADEHRSAMAEWIVQKHLGKSGFHPSIGNRIYEDIRRIANKQFEETRRRVARGLPTYRVAFGTGV